MTYKQQTSQQTKDMIQQFDLDKDGVLNWSDFLHIFNINENHSLQQIWDIYLYNINIFI